MCFPHNAEFRPPALEYLGNVDKHGTRLDQFVRGGRYWHVDGSQNALPMVMTWISAAADSAQCGGSSTLFASGVRALELLPPADRALACSLAVRYSTRDPETLARGAPAGAGTGRNAAAPSLSPLLRNHDEHHGYVCLQRNGRHFALPLVVVHTHSISIYIAFRPKGHAACRTGCRIHLCASIPRLGDSRSGPHQEIWCVQRFPVLTSES
eukprot:SAG11_NODE_25_length_23789_cov_23.813592_12_plen_210_part_00